MDSETHHYQSRMSHVRVLLHDSYIYARDDIHGGGGYEIVARSKRPFAVRCVEQSPTDSHKTTKRCQRYLDDYSEY